MTKTDKVVHAIRTFRNLYDLVQLLAWHVDKRGGKDILELNG